MGKDNAERDESLMQQDCCKGLFCFKPGVAI